jgi:hypothetical protein
MQEKIRGIKVKAAMWIRKNVASSMMKCIIRENVVRPDE